MEVDLLCSGSKGNACLVRTAKACVLIDCGPSTVRYLKQSLESVHCSIPEIQALFITHTHSDHIRQLRFFTHCPVYAPCALHPVDSKKQPVPIDWHCFEAGMSMRVQDLSVQALRLSHDSGPTIGFLMEADGEKLVYITDTGYINGSLMPLLADADYYIMESNHDVSMLMNSHRPMVLKQRILSDEGHLANENAAWVLSHCVSKRTKVIVLAHLSEETNTPELALGALHRRFVDCNIDESQLDIRVAGQYEVTSFGNVSAVVFLGHRQETVEKSDKDHD